MTITETAPLPATPPPPRPTRSGPTAGRVVALALGAGLVLGSASALATAVLLDGVDDDRRDGAYLTTDQTSLHTDTHALVVEEIDLNGLDGDWLLGRARLRATAYDDTASVFVGVARTDDVEAYLRGVAHTTVEDVDDQEPTYDDHAGAAPSTTPGTADIWVAQASGPGTQDLVWTPRDGDWSAVIMNSDASADLDVTADVGATVPAFAWLVRALWAVGAGLGAAGALLVGGALALRRRS